MSKRRTAAEQKRIRVELRQAILYPPAPEPLVRKTLSCGHEAEVLPLLDPAQAVCPQCKNLAQMRRV